MDYDHVDDELDDDEEEVEEDDGWQEHKDHVAMGYINPDGTDREPIPPDDF